MYTRNTINVYSYSYEVCDGALAQRSNGQTYIAQINTDRTVGPRLRRFQARVGKRAAADFLLDRYD